MATKGLKFVLFGFLSKIIGKSTIFGAFLLSRLCPFASFRFRIFACGEVIMKALSSGARPLYQRKAREPNMSEWRSGSALRFSSLGRKFGSAPRNLSFAFLTNLFLLLFCLNSVMRQQKTSKKALFSV